MVGRRPDLPIIAWEMALLNYLGGRQRERGRLGQTVAYSRDRNTVPGTRMKRIVVCTDGTWNSKDRASSDGTGLTNVGKLAAEVAPRDAAGVEQLVYYHPGVGTGWWWDRVAGGAFGVGLSRNIKECYVWLVERYEPGDELYLFGFSRGAYTARSLVGFVRNCGVLRHEHSGLVDKAYDFYRDRAPETHPRGAMAADFRARFAQPGQPTIKCVGVWDTVGSLGVPTSGPVGWLTRKRYGFHDVTLSSWVQNAFQALAVDERRKPFAPALWEVSDADTRKPTFQQRVDQVWFAGVHSNVGGGYADAGLSDLALAWMYARARECGLELRPDATAKLRADVRGKLCDSMSWYYKAFGALVRIINMPRKDASGAPMRTFERVDRSVFDRRRIPDLKYDPPNVRGIPEPAAAEHAITA